MKTIDELAALIRSDFAKSTYDKFIHDVTFPNFKKISPYEKLVFRFPLTLLVGPNGGGKSSILHALWGMPLQRSTSRFWFSTPVDPIAEEAGDKRNVPRYWYTHYISGLGKKVQTRKVKGNKRNGYWEPSRPSVRDGMDVVPLAKKTAYRSTDRWTPVRRSVEYINTKAETSAFDRFFYYTDLELLHERQDKFVLEATRLRDVIDNNLQSKRIGRGEFVFSHFEIRPAALDIINRILGKDYLSARYIVHRFYDRNKAPSVIFETVSHTYSESFAGSGELSVVNLVLAIEKLEPCSLLLLDEPETSLHPGAQKELLRYLLDQINAKKLQIVISTHSPTLVDLVPDEALIVREQSHDGVVIRHDVHKTAAFYRLGQQDPKTIAILTEDVLLKAMVERSLIYLDASLRKKCEVIAVTLGVSEMLSHQVQAFMMTGARNIMVLDGDQEPFMKTIDVDLKKLSEEQQNELFEKIKSHHVSLVGTDPQLGAYIDWCKRRIRLISEICPEELFLYLLNPGHTLLGKGTNQQFKKSLRSALKARGDETDSHSMVAVFKSKLGEAMKNDPKVQHSLEGLARRIESALVEVGI